VSRIGENGARIGPELTQIFKRFQGVKLLQQIIEPSLEINKDHQTWLAVLNSGKTISGLITNENDTHVILLPNPLAPQTQVEIARADIEDLLKSKQSTMPEGLLMSFSREEILDLVAFLSMLK